MRQKPNDVPIADRIFEGGTVLTLSDSQPTAEAVAIKDGLILAVGSNEDIRRHRGPDTDVLSLEGRTLVPGFTDTLSLDDERQNTIEPGRRADLVVLSDNPIAVPPEAIHTLRVVLAVKDGRSVFIAEDEREPIDEDEARHLATVEAGGWLV